MSFQAMTWVMGLDDLKVMQHKFVLLMVANYADSEGRCWPSNARLGRDCCCSESTVRRSLQWLEQNGYITRQERPGKPDLIFLASRVWHPCPADTPVQQTPLAGRRGRGVPQTGEGCPSDTRTYQEPIQNLSTSVPTVTEGVREADPKPDPKPDQDNPPPKPKPKPRPVAPVLKPLPEDYTFTDEHLQAARKKGLSDATAREQFELFTNHFWGTGARHANWLATWRKWVFNYATGFSGTRSNAGGGDRHADTGRLVAVRRLNAKIAQGATFSRERPSAYDYLRGGVGSDKGEPSDDR